MAKKKVPQKFSKEELAAAKTAIARRDRMEHPHGRFDDAGRWIASAAEYCECCEDIRMPSRAYPYSMMVHCRSIQHVANLYKVDATAVRRAVKLLDEKELDQFMAKCEAAARI